MPPTSTILKREATYSLKRSFVGNAEFVNYALIIVLRTAFSFFPTGSTTNTTLDIKLRNVNALNLCTVFLADSSAVFTIMFVRLCSRLGLESIPVSRHEECQNYA